MNYPTKAIIEPITAAPLKLSAELDHLEKEQSDTQVLLNELEGHLERLRGIRPETSPGENCQPPAAPYLLDRTRRLVSDAQKANRWLRRMTGELQDHL